MRLSGLRPTSSVCRMMPAAGDWKKELAVLDRRLKVVELRLRETREYNNTILSVNFDVDPQTAEKMAVAFLAQQRTLKANGESDGR